MEEKKLYIHNGVEHEITAEEEADWLLEHDGATLKNDTKEISVENTLNETGEENINTDVVKEEEEEIEEDKNEEIEDGTQEINQSQDNLDIQDDLIQKEFTDKEIIEQDKRSRSESYTGPLAHEVIGGDHNTYLNSRPDIMLHAGNADDWFKHAIENGLPLDGKDGRADEFILNMVYNKGYGFNPTDPRNAVQKNVDPDTNEILWSVKIPSNSRETTKKLIETHKKNKLENTDLQDKIKEQREEKEWDNIKKSTKEAADWKSNYFEEKIQLENTYEPINIKSSIKGNLAETEFGNVDEILTYDNAKQWFDNRSYFVDEYFKDQKGADIAMFKSREDGSKIALYNDDEFYNRQDEVKEKIMSGKYGYNPHEDRLYLLSEDDQVSVSKEDKLLGSKEYGESLSLRQMNNDMLKSNPNYESFVDNPGSSPRIVSPQFFTLSETETIKKLQQHYFKHGFQFQQDNWKGSAVKIIKPGGDKDGIEGRDYIVVPTNYASKTKSGAIENANKVNDWIAEHATYGTSELDIVLERVREDIGAEVVNGKIEMERVHNAVNYLDELKEAWGMSSKTDHEVLDLYAQINAQYLDDKGTFHILDGKMLGWRNGLIYDEIGSSKAAELWKLLPDEFKTGSKSKMTQYRRELALVVEGQNQYIDQIVLSAYIKQHHKYKGDEAAFYKDHDTDTEDGRKALNKAMGSSDFRYLKKRILTDSKGVSNPKLAQKYRDIFKQIDFGIADNFGRQLANETLYIEDFEEELRSDIIFLSDNWWNKADIQKKLFSESKVDLKEVKEENANLIVDIKNTSVKIEDTINELTPIMTSIDTIQKDTERFAMISAIANEYGATNMNNLATNEAAMMRIANVDPEFAKELLTYNVKLNEIIALEKLYRDKNTEIEEGSLNESELMLLSDGLKRNHEPGTVFVKGAWNSTVDAVQMLTLDLADLYLNISLDIAGGKNNLRGRDDKLIKAYIQASDYLEQESARWDEKQADYRSTWRKSKDFNSISSLSDVGDWLTHFAGEQAANTVLVVATGGYAPIILSTQSGTGKWRELTTERNLYFQTGGEQGQDHGGWSMYGNVALTALSEYAFEKFITLPIVNNAKKARNLGKFGFDNGLKTNIFDTKSIALSMGIYTGDTFLEGLGEGLTQFTSNWADIYLSGMKDVHIYDGVDESFASGIVMTNAYKSPSMANKMMSPFRTKDYNQKVGENETKILNLINQVKNRFDENGFTSASANTTTTFKNGEVVSQPISETNATDAPAYEINGKSVTKEEMVKFVLDGGLKGEDGSFSVSNDIQVQDLINADPDSKKQLAQIIELTDKNYELLQNEIKRIDVLSNAEKKELITLDKEDFLARKMGDDIMLNDKLSDKEKELQMAKIQEEVDARADQRDAILNKYTQADIDKKHQEILQTMNETLKEAELMGAPKVVIKTLNQKDYAEEVKKYKENNEGLDSKELENIASEKEGIVQGLNEIINDKNSTPEEIQDAREKLKNPESVVNIASNILNNSDYGVMQPKFDKDGNISDMAILMNRDAAIEDGRFNELSHEFVHATFANTLKFDPKAREVLGDQLQEILTGDDVVFSSRRKANEFNKRVNSYDPNLRGEEGLAIISQMMMDGDVKFKTSALQKSKDVFRRYSQDYLNAPIAFNKSNDIKNFLKDYHYSIKNNKPSKAIAKMLAKGANGKMFKNAKTPADRKNMSMFSESSAVWMKNNPKIVNKYDQHTRNEDGSKKYKNKKEWKEKGEADNVAVWQYIMDSGKGSLDSRILEEQGGFDPKGLPFEVQQDYMRKVKTELQMRWLKNFDPKENNSAAGYLFGKNGILYWAKQTVQKDYFDKEGGTDKRSLDRQTSDGQSYADVIEAEKESIYDEIDNADLSVTAKKANKDMLDDLIMVMDLFGLPNKVKKAVENNVKETYIPLDIITDPNAKFSTYKNIKKLLVEKEFDPKVLNPKTGKQAKSEKAVIPTGPLFETLNAISSDFGVDPLRILANQNLDDNQRKLAQGWIFDKAVNEDGTLNNNVINALPEGADRSGRATGLSKKLLEAFYIKGGRAEFAGGATASGLATQTKRTNITKEEFLNTFGINPDGSLQPGTDADGAINQYVVQVATLAAIQEVTMNTIENELAQANIIARLNEGKGEQVFSKRFEQVENFIQDDFQGGEFIGKDHVLKIHGLPKTFKIKSKKDIKTYIHNLKTSVLPLLPKEAWFGPREGTAFTSNARHYFDSSSNPLWPVLMKEIQKLKNDKSIKYGKPIPGVKASEIWSLRNQFSSLFKNPETLRNNKEKIKKFNNNVGAIHKALWVRINEAIKKDRTIAPHIAHYLGLVANDTKNWHKLGAQAVGFSKKITGARYELEHAMPATSAYLYLLNSSLAPDIDFNTAYDLVIDNYKLIALDKAMDTKLRDARTLSGFSLQRRMPDNWSVVDGKFWQRYFNNIVEAIDGGIDPNSIEMLDGRTMAETFNINASGDIRIAESFSKRKAKETINDAFSAKISNAVNSTIKGMSTFDFDDTLARTKSGIRYTIPNNTGKPMPGKKVIFLAGSAGSGKSNVVKQLGLEAQGFKMVNQDISLEWLAKNSGLPTDMRDFTPEQASKWGELQWEARDIAQRKATKFKGRGDGVVVDGTGASTISMSTQVQKYKDAGYDVQMLFVESSLETALERNKARQERSLKDFIVERNWKAVQKNKKAFKEEFGNNFAEVNTNKLKQGDPMPKTLVNKINDFTTGYIKGRLTAEEFANKGDNLLQQGAEFDFSEFNKVVDGTPGPLLQKARNRAEKYGTKDMFVLTARPQASAFAIQQFLKGQGLDIPIKNITGLANSTGNAKAQWMLEKFAEGYNDMYFVDDALQNVKAVKKVLDQLDIKSNVVQAFSKRINDANLEFNKIIERRKGVKAEKVFSSAEARKRGSQPNIARFIKSLYIPPSAEDFKGLLYYFLGKGKQGDADMRFFADNLLTPFAKGIKAWNSYKQNMVNDYKALKKEFPKVKKNLNKKIPGTSFTNDTAVRVYLWSKAGFDIPGISKSLQQTLVNHVNNNSDIKSFAESLSIITKRKDGYIKPNENWMMEAIPSDLRNVVDKIGRKEFLEEWIENKNIIFSPENLNKVEALYGGRFLESLEDILYRMENGGNRSRGKDSDVNWFTNWINGSVGAIMFFNMRSAVLQTISTVNFINWSDNNMFKASAAFANQPQFWKDFVKLFNSDQLKQRRGGLQTDVSASELTKTFAEKGYSPQTVINHLLQFGFKPTQLADSFAIAFGGATFYRNRYNKYIKEGMSKSAAQDQTMLDFQEIAEETQQSSREDLISQQQASVLGRIVLAFQNVTMQYGRLTKKSLSDLINGRGDWKTNVSKIAYYGMVQNIVFSALQNALAFLIWGDEEDELIEDKTTRTLNSTLDSFLRGTGLYGALASTLKNTVVQWENQKDKEWGKERIEKIALEVVNLSPPIGSKVRKIVNAYYADAWNEGVSEELGWRIENPKLTMSANIIEALFNVPIARIQNKANNLEEAITGNHETWKRVLLALGWSRWDLGIKDEELEEAKDEAKIKNQEKKKEEKKIEKEKEKEIEEKEKEEKGIKTVQCSGVGSSGQRCGNTTETAEKTWKCYHHMDFEDGMDRDGDGIKEYRCTAIKSNGDRCKNKTENESKKCYAHQ